MGIAAYIGHYVEAYIDTPGMSKHSPSLPDDLLKYQGHAFTRRLRVDHGVYVAHTNQVLLQSSSGRGTGHAIQVGIATSNNNITGKKIMVVGTSTSGLSPPPHCAEHAIKSGGGRW
jgi:hypothetical protein|eukprot:CAMPEP_0174356692 /NCGR_PEP_ID=MMETSP0811_2-20130205/31345_1 /TAXON_ID=73025 ORGANISM="Eutreptiella gymnastica-like, Strain CCMP1594" /NCGR_SAMPLE_ID=MMETSP0811_2 /ASSEMBLY_ACC=CAM_ASM_000667 /LENGTH=115 /DNA_ID=CAMNT_0015488893 /DNA_START=681 /DNA_END=1028 /DNA_ORIENTATION=+